ncbi:MAG TPA: 30S ribosomal protein S6 [Candidatus Saccharimonadales bacterium]|nr:30S ribosomal protein S6 [Candidatus Saccharimonadales bacterium]
MNRDYELVVLLHPDLEIDLEKPLAKLRQIIADNKGEITKEDSWGKRKLAYRINNEDFAVYTYIELSLPAETVKKLQSTLNITDEVLRYLLTAVDPKAVAAQAEAEAKEKEAKDKDDEAKESKEEE